MVTSVWGERGDHDGSTPCDDSTPCLHSCPALLQRHSSPRTSSLPSPLVIFPQSTAVLALGLLSNPYSPAPSHCAFQGTRILSRVGRAAAKIVWFSFLSDCHRLVSSLPNCFKCLPHPSGWPWTRGSLPCASAPSPPGAGWSHLLSSFFPLPPCPFFPLSYQVLCGSGCSFSVVRESCQDSPGLLGELLPL